MLRGMPSPAAMRVVTWNVNGIRARFGEVVELCRVVEPDLLCLQELKAAPSQVPEPLTGLPAYASFWHGGPGGYSGVSLHVRRAWASETGAAARFAPPAFDVQSRAIEVALAPGLRALSLYVPNGNRDLPGKLAFLSALRGCGAALVAAVRRRTSPDTRPISASSPPNAIIRPPYQIQVTNGFHHSLICQRPPSASPPITA